MDVLFIGNNVYPITDANGNCILAVAEQLQKRGFKIHIVTNVAYDNKNLFCEFKGIKIYNLRKNYFDKCMYDYPFSKVFRCLYRVMQLILCPIDDVYSYFRVHRLIKRLDKIHHFGAIVSVFHPTCSLFLGGWLKRRKKLVLYMLDTLVCYIPQHPLLPSCVIRKRYMQLEQWIYKKADLIINMQNYKMFYSGKKEYDFCASKMRYSDLPLFCPLWNISKKKNFFKNDKINISFMGTLYPEFRSANYMLRMMEPILEEENCVLHFFSRGEEDIIKHYSKNKTCIISHGFVSHNIANDVKLDTDIFINIANNGVNMLPSKIFEYMSYGKKIIHFYRENEDTCISYLKKYPYVLMINENDDMKANQNKFKRFIQESIDLSKLESLKNEFKMNSPEYTADIIMEELDKSNG